VPSFNMSIRTASSGLITFSIRFGTITWNQIRTIEYPVDTPTKTCSANLYIGLSRYKKLKTIKVAKQVKMAANPFKEKSQLKSSLISEPPFRE